MDIAPHSPDTRRASAGRLGARLYRQIKAEILGQSLPPGLVLQEQALAERFGGSRTPVREALCQLLEDGLVTRRGRLYQVRRLSPEDIRELYEVREALEIASVCLAAARAGDSGLAELAVLIADQEAALHSADIARFSEFDGAFHLHIASLAGNATLLRQISMLHDKVRLVRLAPAGFLARALDEHRRIADALQRREAAVAVAEMRSHIRSVVRLYADDATRPSAA